MRADTTIKSIMSEANSATGRNGGNAVFSYPKHLAKNKSGFIIAVEKNL